MAGIHRIKGGVKHYDWGGDSFIPSLLQIENKQKRPFAEYWLGAHANDHCKIEIAGKDVLLKEYIEKHPETLGKKLEKKFGGLPFLLKALDVKDMLSIQVHPSKKAAKKEFKRENKEGIPLDSPKRNYKDDNHKPELMVAMSDFWLLHGFKKKKEIRNILTGVPEFNLLSVLFEKFSYEGLYKTIMEMPQHEVNIILQPLLDRIIPLYKENKLDRSQEDFWAARAALIFSKARGTENREQETRHKAQGTRNKEQATSNHPDIDRGIFSIYLFNLVQLKEGEGIFQDAGAPHAYLEGQNVEIMASSDNVLRGGLTNKHIDVKELLKHIKPEPTKVEILKGKEIAGEIVYKTLVPDFQLSKLQLKKGESISISARGPEIILLTSGHAAVKDKTENVELKMGAPAAIIFNKEKAHLTAFQDSVLFKASVPFRK